jgi:hypothetical protein
VIYGPKERFAEARDAFLTKTFPALVEYVSFLCATSVTLSNKFTRLS